MRLAIFFTISFACFAINSATAHAGPYDFFNSTIEKIASRFKKQPPPKTFFLDELVPQELRLLPIGVQRWYVLETDFLSRIVDPLSSLASPTQNEQLLIYTPEAKLPFKMKGYWIPLENMHFKKTTLPTDLEKQLLREKSGQTEVLFFIHPETERHFSEILNSNYETETFWAAATSSSRSLLVWKPGFESQPFIAKVSLYRHIGHTLRSILASETSYSVSVTDLIRQSDISKNNAIFMEEVLGAVPIGREDGGMIIRTFPKEILNDPSLTYAPLFSLYAKTQDQPAGLLLQMLQNSDLDPRVFVTEKIIRPYVRIWFDLAIKEGLTAEAHAQNILMELNGDHLTGRFIFRDFGGLSVDAIFREESGLYVPPNFKNFGGQAVGNFGQKHSVNLMRSLEIYFTAGFLYNIESAIQRWASKGWIQLDQEAGDLRKDWAKSILLDELSKVFGSPKLKFSELPDLIKKKQDSQRDHSATKSCKNLLLNTTLF